MIWGKVCVELFCGWMVGMVQLFESGCYEAKSVLCCYVAEWWIWLSSGRVGVMGRVSVERLVVWWYGQPLTLSVSEGKVYEGYIEHRTRRAVQCIVD